MKTANDLRILRAFFNSPEIKESREIHQIPVPELSSVLCRFLISVKKKNGDEYEPSCLRGIISSFDRHLRRKTYGQSIAHGLGFARVREILSMKQRQLKSVGKGNHPQKRDALSDDDIEKLWITGQLGSATPDIILQTLWLFNTVHFGLRSSQEHRDLCWGDIALYKDENGHEYLQFTERRTNMRSGETPRDVRVVPPKLWSNDRNTDRYPVDIYKIYAGKRPTDYSDSSHPFYIAATTVPLLSPHDLWFKRSPVGVNKLSSTLKRMVLKAGLKPNKKLSNRIAYQPKTMMIKEEPVDPEYERTAQRNGQVLPETSSDISISLREQLKQMVENKGEELTIQGVIENLLQKNELIQSQSSGKQLRSQTNTVNSKATEIGKEINSVLQPKDPTASCSKEDASYINEALIEVDVTEADSGTDTDLVCAVSSKVVLKVPQRQSLQMDITFYWCNFCGFKSDKKEKLLQHGMEHRFHCKYCKYQSFSRAAVIKHSVDEHPAFGETASNLKYCSFLPDILQRHETQKRKASDNPSDETIPSKKPRNDPEGNDPEETVLTLKMEVEEVQENKEIESATEENIMQPQQRVKTRSSLPAPIKPKPVQPPKLMPKPKQEDMVLPVITNVISGEQAVSAVTGTSNSRPSSSNDAPPAAAAPPNGAQGSNQLIVSSGLCWNCGYCGFVTLSQSFLKLHLNAKHQGQAHKYVAMLVSSDEELEKIKASDQQIAQNPATTHVEIVSSGHVATDQNSPKPITVIPSSTQPPSEPFGIEIDNAELGVLKEKEAPVPDEAEKKIPISYKCAHCNFTAPASEKVKAHLFQRHNGCVMYSLDMRAVKLGKRRYVFFCMKTNCSFETKEVSEFLEHSEVCTPWLDGGDHSDIESSLIKSLEMTKKFVLKTQKSVGGQLKQFRPDKVAAEYNCIYCSFVSNNNTRLKKHVLSLHFNKSCVIRDLLAGENKRKPYVYFCKHCLWETRNEEDLVAHLAQVHNSTTSANTVTRDTTVNSGSASSTNQAASKSSAAKS